MLCPGFLAAIYSLYIDMNHYHILLSPSAPNTAHLQDHQGELVAFITYDPQSEHFDLVQSEALPAHFVERFLAQARKLLTPRHATACGHTWFLLDRREHCVTEHGYPAVNEDTVWMDENFFHVLYSWLKWIPTWCPRSECSRQGFEFYNAVELRHDGVSSSLSMLMAFRQLLTLAPEHVEMSGGWRLPWQEDVQGNALSYSEEGYPGKLSFNASQALQTLEQLIDLNQRLESSSKHHYILHIGV